MNILENRPIRAVVVAAIALFMVAGAALGVSGHPFVATDPSASAPVDTSSASAAPSAVVTTTPVGDETQPPDLDNDRSAAPSKSPDVDASQKPDLDHDRTGTPTSGDKDGDKGSSGGKDSGGNQGGGGDEGSGSGGSH
jgi:uncharacterized membrane protein YgcG